MNPILIWLMIPKRERDELEAAAGEALMEVPAWALWLFVFLPLLAFDVCALYVLLS